MTEYDVEGFCEWLRKKYVPDTAAKYLKVITRAAELGVDFEELKTLDAKEVYVLTHGPGVASKSTYWNYRSRVSSYEQYLDYKERNK